MTHPPLNTTVKLIFLIWGSIVLSIPGIAFSQKHDSGWSNPILIAGSDFGRVFQAYYKTSNQEMLLALTSQKSRTEYGDSTIMNYYSKMQFAYSIKLMAHKKVDNCWSPYICQRVG